MRPQINAQFDGLARAARWICETPRYVEGQLEEKFRNIEIRQTVSRAGDI